ncbi:hypothetical protein [Priestia megaterium]|uniref:hypothetical protein n=1 Tax=Priestia megaterium TaxID=1404 RepID=UPI001CB9AC2B
MEALYWRNAGHISLLQSLLQDQMPRLNGAKLIVNARHDAEGTALRKKYSQLIADQYASYGFPNLQLMTEVVHSEEAFQQFVEQRKQEDTEKVLQAITEMQNKENEKSDGPDLPKGPLTIGYTIKDETVAWTPLWMKKSELPLKDTYLMQKLGNYEAGVRFLFLSDRLYNSIMVKMFSRDKEDIPLLQAIKKGMW